MKTGKSKIFGLITLLIISSFLVYGCSGSKGSNGNAGQTYKNISAEQLKNMMDSNKNAIVVDVREQGEYDMGHIPGSILIPLSTFQSRVSELPKEEIIILVCSTDSRSPQVAAYMSELGYHEIYNLSGGLMEWPYGLER